MRLAVLVSLYPALSHSFIRREVEELRRRGAEVHAFSLRQPGPETLVSEADRSELATTTCLLPPSAGELGAAHAWAASRPAALARLLRDAWGHRMPGLRSAGVAAVRVAEALLLARELERRGLRHLHCHFANAGGDVAYLASRFLKIGVSFTLHGSADFDGPTRPLLREKIAAARFVACVSHFGRAQACRASDPENWDKIFVSRCGIDAASVAREAGRAARRDRPTLLSVGRLSPEKGQVGLLRAVARARAAGADLDLRIVGDGPDRSRLEAAIAELGLRERVQLLGPLPADAVFREMGAAHLFVLTSFMEGLPVVLMEAMAAGTPVLAPRITGIPELVDDGVSGVLFRPADWDELAHAAAALLADEPRCRRLAEAGRRRVEQEFSVERAVDPLWRRLRDVVG